jgi:hypothetical protein
MISVTSQLITQILREMDVTYVTIRVSTEQARIDLQLYLNTVFTVVVMLRHRNEAYREQHTAANVIGSSASDTSFVSQSQPIRLTEAS